MGCSCLIFASICTLGTDVSQICPDRQKGKDRGRNRSHLPNWTCTANSCTCTYVLCAPWTPTVQFSITKPTERAHAFTPVTCRSTCVYYGDKPMQVSNCKVYRQFYTWCLFLDADWSNGACCWTFSQILITLLKGNQLMCLPKSCLICF